MELPYTDLWDPFNEIHTSYKSTMDKLRLFPQGATSTDRIKFYFLRQILAEARIQSLYGLERQAQANLLSIMPAFTQPRPLEEGTACIFMLPD